MEFLIITLFAVLAVTAQSQNETEIDWSKVKPISEHPDLKTDRENHIPIHLSNGNRRIIGGRQASKSQFPYQAGIICTEAAVKYLGGGSLISSTRVLTAAHNVRGVTSALVILGAIYLSQKEPNQVIFNVPSSEMFCHPKYDPDTLYNDIAMIKLPSAVKFNNYISPIALPQGTNDYVGVTGVISGWGEFDEMKEQSKFLRYANMKVITNSKCEEEYDEIIDSTLCALGVGDVIACVGDSG